MCIFADTPQERKELNEYFPMINIDNDVAFDSGSVDVPNNEPVLLDTNISSSGKFKDIWGMNQRWEFMHVIAGVVNTGFDTMDSKSKIV